MNGYWKVLGIAPTGDKKAIRAAYSAMTRQCHPEEDPEGFKLLHEAYQAAMAYASSSAGRAERREEMPEGPGKEERADKPENAQNGGTASAEKIPRNHRRSMRIQKEKKPQNMRPPFLTALTGQRKKSFRIVCAPAHSSSFLLF